MVKRLGGNCRLAPFAAIKRNAPRRGFSRGPTHPEILPAEIGTAKRYGSGIVSAFINRTWKVWKTTLQRRKGICPTRLTIRPPLEVRRSLTHRRRPFLKPSRLHPQKGSSALKIILIIVGIFVVIGVIVVGVVGYGIYRVAHTIKKDATTGQISLNTPGGAFSANTSNTITESDLGIAIYPGAAQAKGGLRMNIAGKSMVSANFLTADSKDQVIAFYKDKVGPTAQSIMTDNGAQFVAAASNGDTVTVSISQIAGMNDGKTQITIIRASKG